MVADQLYGEVDDIDVSPRVSGFRVDAFSTRYVCFIYLLCFPKSFFSMQAKLSAIKIVESETRS